MERKDEWQEEIKTVCGMCLWACGIIVSRQDAKIVKIKGYPEHSLEDEGANINMSTRVGFIGLGNIGKPMAINIAGAGFDLMVYDTREESLAELSRLGAKIARSAKEIGAHAEIIEIVVVNDAQVKTLTFGKAGLLEGAKSGSIIAIHSTVHPQTVKEIAEAARMKGVGVIDAQISGGAKGAAEKTLCFMVGGEKALCERCREVFSVSGTGIFHLGALGSGALAKLAHNIIVYVNMLAASEGMRLA